MGERAEAVKREECQAATIKVNMNKFPTSMDSVTIASSGDTNGYIAETILLDGTRLTMTGQILVAVSNLIA